MDNRIGLSQKALIFLDTFAKNFSLWFEGHQVESKIISSLHHTIKLFRYPLVCGGYAEEFIQMRIAKTDWIALRIFDSQGRQVREIRW